METEANDAAQPSPSVANGEESTNPLQLPPAGDGASGIQPPKVRALPKPSGIRPPTANLHGGSTNSLASTSSQLTTASSAATGTATSTTSTRIGRLCMGHTPPKAGPPPPEPKLSTHDSKMRRPSDSDYNKSHLPDVDEESETDLAFERPISTRSSHSPDSGFKSNRSDRKTSSASTGSDVYWEATGRRRSSDQGAVLTTDTDSFIIGQRVWVGGIRPGQIAYIGETHFAPGEWAGVVLDEPNGKNDGSVAGKRYFQCEAKKGVFSRLTRLTREPLAAGGGGGDSTASTPLDASFRSLTSPARSGTVSPTHSVQSYASKSPAMAGKAASLNVGDRVIVSSGFGSRPGILKFIGETQFASGTWCGVQLDEASGKNDGTVEGVRYFECPAKYGIFVPIAKVTLSPSGRKTSARLSRANSKESLNSLATMSSIATTATSRLRMSAQRKSTVSAVPSTPKASFSLQDVLREKQNHIEQLMQEREIDREETASQSIMYQKNIQQLKEKVTLLEKSLSDEKRRNEDLQFSVDEATFCSEELNGKIQNSVNAQTQVFKEKIADLEAQLAGGPSAKSNQVAQVTDPSENFIAVKAELNAEIDKLKAEILAKDQKLNLTEELKRSLENEIQNLHEKVADAERSADSKLSALTISEECLKEQINYLEHRVEEQSDQLTVKDAELEQQYLALKNAESEQEERLAAIQDELRSKKDILAEREKATQMLEQTMEDLRADVRQRDLKMVEMESDLKVKLQERDTSGSKLSEKVVELEATIAEVSASKSKLDQELTSVMETIKVLEQDRNEKEKTVQQMESKLSSSEASLQAEVVLRQEKESIVLKLQQELQSLATDGESSAALLNSKQEEISKQANLLQQMEADKVRLQQDLTTQQQRYERSQSEHDVLIVELHAHVDTERNAMVELRKQLQGAEQENLAKDKQLEENEVLVGALQNELKELNVSKTNLQQELTATKASFADKDGTLSNILQEKTDLEKRLEESRQDMMAKVRQLEEDLQIREESLRKELETNKSTAQEQLSKQDGELSRLTQAGEELQKQLVAAQQQLKEELDKRRQAEEKIVAKTTEAQTLEQQLASLQADMTLKGEQITKLNTALSECNVREEAGGKKLSEAQEQYGKLEIEHADLRRKMEALEQKSAQVHQQKLDLEKELDTQRSSTLDSNSELAKLNDELKAKQRALDELRDSYDTLKIETERRADENAQINATLQDQVERARQEMQQITNQKVIQENELNMELRKIKENAEQEQENLVRTIADLKTNFEQERQRIAGELSEEAAKNCSLSEELVIVRKSLENTVEELKSQLENALVATKKEEELKEFAVREATKRETTLQKQVQQSQEETSNLRLRLENVQKSMEQGSQDLSIKIDQKAQRIVELEQELGEKRSLLQKRTVEVNEMIEKLQENGKAHAEMLQQLQDCYSQIESQKKANQQSEESCQQVQQRLQDLNSSYREMEEEQVDLVSREETLKKELASLQDQMQRAALEHKERFDVIASKNEELLKQLETASTAKGATETELNTLKQQLENKSSALVALQAQVDELNPLLQTKVDLEGQLQSLEQTVSAKDATVLELSGALEELKKQTLLKDAKIMERDDEFKQLGESMATKETQLKDLQQQYDSVEKSLAESTEHDKRASGEVAELTVALEKSRSTQKEQEDRLKEQQRRVSELETKLTAQTTQFDELLNRKKSSETEYSHRTHELSQKLLEMESAKKQEIQELQQRLAELMQKVETQVSETAQTVSGKRVAEKRQQELECAKKELELRETELQLANRRFEKENEHLRSQLVVKESELTKLAMAANNAASAADIGVRNRIVSETKEDDSGAQIDFLNSIIVDMQRKNEKLTLRIQALESTSAESHNMSFEIQKRKPAPRVFCDICDEFDLHETEDCPKQSSDSPPESLKHPSDGKERKVPPPRKYCESCEVFGHEIGECPDDETY
ncbi:restin homolog isoform X1 [Anopheles moucheti]|uniref:restin homolog isoform X1 n=1 Tax=Anopheles moucheti TaxID=186751 RepID=UPI0022F0D069|nr:restin homolog isoform X1 [Anopheles moucheti]